MEINKAKIIAQLEAKYRRQITAAAETAAHIKMLGGPDIMNEGSTEQKRTAKK